GATQSWLPPMSSLPSPPTVLIAVHALRGLSLALQFLGLLRPHLGHSVEFGRERRKRLARDPPAELGMPPTLGGVFDHVAKTNWAAGGSPLKTCRFRQRLGGAMVRTEGVEPSRPCG